MAKVAFLKVDKFEKGEASAQIEGAMKANWSVKGNVKGGKGDGAPGPYGLKRTGFTMSGSLEMENIASAMLDILFTDGPEDLKIHGDTVDGPGTLTIEKVMFDSCDGDAPDGESKDASKSKANFQCDLAKVNGNWPKPSDMISFELDA